MIHVQNAVVGYGGKPVIARLSLDIKAGECIALIGPNGSGKSTLLKALAGQLPLRSGEILLDGKPLSALSPKARASRIGYFPQNRPVPNMDVYTLVTHGRYPHLGFGRVMGEQDKALVQAALEQANALQLSARALSSLSGGERQRAYLAMLIAQDPEILLLDEPATFLDVTHQIEVSGILHNLHKRGKTVLFSAHDLPSAFESAERMLLLQNGALVHDAPPEQMAQSAAIHEVFGVRITRQQSENALFSYLLSK